MKSTTPVNTNQTKKPITASPSKEKVIHQLFDKENLKWMLGGLIVIAIGFILMAGGKNNNPFLQHQEHCNNQRY